MLYRSALVGTKYSPETLNFQLCYTITNGSDTVSLFHNTKVIPHVPSGVFKALIP